MFHVNRDTKNENKTMIYSGLKMAESYVVSSYTNGLNLVASKLQYHVV